VIGPPPLKASALFYLKKLNWTFPRDSWFPGSHVTRNFFLIGQFKSRDRAILATFPGEQLMRETLIQLTCEFKWFQASANLIGGLGSRDVLPRVPHLAISLAAGNVKLGATLPGNRR
jgi:hypothetical protein